MDAATELQIAEACRLIAYHLSDGDHVRQRFVDSVAKHALAGMLANADLRGECPALASDAYDFAEALWVEREKRIAAQAKESAQ